MPLLDYARRHQRAQPLPPGGQIIHWRWYRTHAL